MITIYCSGQHHTSHAICGECRSLLEYATQRMKACPFQDGKTTCAKCSIHCYKPGMREKMKQVMRYAGPRMAYTHPILTMLHVLYGFQFILKP